MMIQQIRVCRSARVKHFRQDLVVYGEWGEATSEMASECRAIVRTGNELFGPTSHWVEERSIEAAQILPEVAVRRLIDDSMVAWVQGDMERHLEFFLPSATLVTPLGTCHHGHEGLRHAFAHERQALAEVVMKVDERQITHPKPGMAIVMMEGTLRHSGMHVPERWASTQVAVSIGGQWGIASLQVFHAQRAAMSPPEPEDPALVI